jgi:hypothetical protein
LRQQKGESMADWVRRLNKRSKQNKSIIYKVYKLLINYVKRAKRIFRY